MIKPKYDKFLTSYVVSKRAKEILEEGIHYFPKEEQNKNEILEAIREIEEGILNVEINHTDVAPVKEEEDTLELLYSTIKKQKSAEKEDMNGGLEDLLDVEEDEGILPVEEDDKPISLWEEETKEDDEIDEQIDADELLVDDLDVEPLEEVVIEEDL